MLEKIKNFFKKIFNTGKIKLIEESANIDIINEDKGEISKFKDNIKLENNEEYRILDLQKKFDNDEIKIEEMKEEDKDALISLYIQDIVERLKKINSKETINVDKK